MTEQEEKEFIQQDYIKLSKNSRGYVWEIKCFENNLMKEKDILEKINRINEEMLSSFGNVSFSKKSKYSEDDDDGL